MKYALVAFILLSTFAARAGVVELPRGGKLSLPHKEWNVQETKALTGVNSLLFSHRELSELSGVLLDGTVKVAGDCESGKTVICDRLVPLKGKVSYQIIGQRFIGKDTYQNYVIAFTIDKAREGKLLPVLKKLKSELEFTK